MATLKIPYDIKVGGVIFLDDIPYRINKLTSKNCTMKHTITMEKLE